MIQIVKTSRDIAAVSVLFSEPKIPQYDLDYRSAFLAPGVSVLFSEPKIPQLHLAALRAERRHRFSALQRAENSSILQEQQSAGRDHVSVLFSEPKIPQCSPVVSTRTSKSRFSALQRAENSSILSSSAAAAYGSLVSVLFSEPKIPQFRAARESDQPAFRVFQCSSASRKFLNPKRETSSAGDGVVSVLFSEPKIPQYSRRWRATR